MAYKTLKPGQLFTHKGHVYQVKKLSSTESSFMSLCVKCAFKNESCSGISIRCIDVNPFKDYYFKLIR